MAEPLLLVFYQELPEIPTSDGKSDQAQRLRRKLHRFKTKVEARYFESTLERLLISPNVEVRQAAVLALGLLGTMKINTSLAARLHDEDPTVCQLAGDALWSIWFRGESPENNQELQRLVHLDPSTATPDKVLAGFDALLTKAPTFAEAYNQRAVVQFRIGNFSKAIVDCERVLRLNPHHFGAASGLAQCFMKLKKLRAALRSYRRAARINPNLEGVRQAIESLEKILGEEGKR